MSIFTCVTPRLPVSNLRSTVEFYTRHLGFRTDVLWPEPEPTFAILCRDTTTIGFFESGGHEPGRIGYAELYVQVTNSLALHESLMGAVPVEWGPEVFSYGRREFGFRDPDGYLIIITEAVDDPPTTNEPQG